MGSKISRKPTICDLAAKYWAVIKSWAGSFRTRLGLFFFVVNFPFGYGGLVVSSAIAASTHDSRWLIVGTCCYVISWIMLGLAILFLGSDTVKFLRGSGKRKFRAWRRARRLWKHVQHKAKA